MTVNKDDGAPSCSLKVASGTLGSNGWYISNVTVGWNTRNESTSGMASYSINTPSVTTNGTTTVTGTVTGNNGKSNTCTLKVYKDAATPMITSVNGAIASWTASNRSYTIVTSSASPVQNLYYYISASTTAPSSSTAGTSCGSVNSCSVGNGKYVYFKVINKAGTGSSWYGPYNNYVDSKKISSSFLSSNVAKSSLTVYRFTFNNSSIQAGNNVYFEYLINGNNIYIESIDFNDLPVSYAAQRLSSTSILISGTVPITSYMLSTRNNYNYNGCRFFDINIVDSVSTNISVTQRSVKVNNSTSLSSSYFIWSGAESPTFTANRFSFPVSQIKVGDNIYFEFQVTGSNIQIQSLDFNDIPINYNLKTISNNTILIYGNITINSSMVTSGIHVGANSYDFANLRFFDLNIYNNSSFSITRNDFFLNSSVVH